ncbi:MAG TPA: glycosyltransferase [Candidatus Eisenbacteria bacterium]|nr:glycosyltransferase [Candidatus Eisenbacteria bacterium]
MTLRILYAVNCGLPERDYRVIYAASSARCSVTFALPSRPASVPEERYRRLGFSEGLGWRDAGNALRLAQLLVRHRRELDVAHFYSTKLLLLGPVLARLAGVRSVITVTGFGRAMSRTGPAYRVVRVVYLVLFRVAVRLSSAVLFQNTADLEATAGRLPAARAKMSYIGSAVAMPVQADKDYAGPLGVLLVARVMPAKGVDDFLAAARELAAPGLRFVLVGGPSRGCEQLQREVEAADAAGTISYLGRLEGEALLAAYRAAHVFCFPSRHEGLARVMIEAGYAGLCPVAYDIPGNRDLVVDGTGLLLPPGDRSALVRAVRGLAEDRGELVRRAAAYQSHVSRAFGMDTYRARMDAVLEGLIA